MKRLSVIRLEKFRSTPQREQQGLLPSELEILLNPAIEQETPQRQTKKNRIKRSQRS